MISERYSRLAREGSWIVVGQVLAVSGSLVLVRLLTEYLSPAEYGQLALGLTVALLINQVVMVGLTHGIGRFYAIASDMNDLRGYLWASGKLMAWATLASAVIAMLLMAGLAGFGLQEWVGFAAIILVFSVLTGYNSSLNAIQNAARQRQIVALHGVMDAWLKIALVIGLTLWLGPDITAVVLAYTLSLLIVMGSQLYFLRRLYNKHTHQIVRAKGNWGIQIWTFAWPISTCGIFTWAQQVSDRWALQTFVTSDAVGQYAVLFQIGYLPVSLATGLLLDFLAPVLYQRAMTNTESNSNIAVRRLSGRITGIVLIFTLLAFLLAMSLHEILFSLLVAAPYREVSHWLPYLVLAGGLFAAGQVLALKFMATMQHRRTIKLKIVTALLGVILNAWAAAYFGLAGVIVSMVLFSLVYLMWMLWLTSKE